MTHLDAASPAALQPTQGYWDGQQAQDATQNRFNDAPLRSTDAPAQVADRAVNVADTAIPIQGNDRGSSLPGLQTPDGKRITNSELHVGEQATVTREQTVADYGITSDQVVFTTSTGEGDDDVRISQRDDGTLDVEVNGESYAVRLTERQELTLRTGGGNDTITASPNVTVNLVIDAGSGDDDRAFPRRPRRQQDARHLADDTHNAPHLRISRIDTSQFSDARAGAADGGLGGSGMETRELAPISNSFPPWRRQAQHGHRRSHHA